MRRREMKHLDHRVKDLKFLIYNIVDGSLDPFRKPKTLNPGVEKLGSSQIVQKFLILTMATNLGLSRHPVNPVAEFKVGNRVENPFAPSLQAFGGYVHGYPGTRLVWRAPPMPLRNFPRKSFGRRRGQVQCVDVVPATAPNDQQTRDKRGLFQIARLIGVATLGSKVIGLAREAALAAVFGVGPVMNAFNYASIVPGFFLTMLGGINGPFHTAMTAALSKRQKEEGQHLVASISLLAGLFCTGLSLLIFLNAAQLINTLAPGLSVAADGVLTQQIAVLQLKVMAPCALLAALIGLGFGSLSANGIYGIPSISPALSSVSILAAVFVHVALSNRLTVSPSQQALAGGISLALGSTCGAFLQWGVQVIAQRRAGLGGGLRVSWVNPFKESGIYEVMAVMIPAALNSGLTQVATFTDLHFASYIPGAAAALGYANLLVMAPLGILSSPILLSFLPLFSRLTGPECRSGLRDTVQQGLLLATALTVSLTAVMIPLARPIVQLAFQRRSFDAAASRLVSSLLICYVSGSTFYLTRDILVQVFYALGDGRTPLYITMAGIVTNAILDWLLVSCSGFGAPGLVLATMVVNFLSAATLLFLLTKRVGGFRVRWRRPILTLVCCGVYSATVTQVTFHQWSLLLLPTTSAWASQLLSLGLASGFGFVSYFAPLVLLKVPEARWVVQLLHVNQNQDTTGVPP